jgi:hypothetical protein
MTTNLTGGDVAAGVASALRSMRRSRDEPPLASRRNIVRYRAIQWATGAMGKATLRGMLDHPAVDVVGVYVYGKDKVGLDAGSLARRDPTGVRATNDIDEILALDADVVVHAGRLGPYGAHDADLIRLLRSGKNVISINGYTHPGGTDDARTAALREAAGAGGVTLVGAGLNPGYIGEQIAVVATSLCASIDCLEIVESADGREIREPDYLFGALGFAADIDAHDPNDPTWGPVSALNGMYEESLRAVAFHLGMTLDRIESDHVLYPATEDLRLPAGTVPKGTVSHTNWRWHGYTGDRRRLTLSINWYVETAHLEDPNPALWSLHIAGHSGLRLSLDLEKHPDDRSRMSVEQYAVAGSVLNTIPLVVAAPPGLLTRPFGTPAPDDYLAATTTP